MMEIMVSKNFPHLIKLYYEIIRPHLKFKVNGKMVIPIGKLVQKMTLITRVSVNKFEKRTFGDYRFVPMLKNKY